MSMILEALTRAEQERQIESQPNLKFVTPVKQRRKSSSNAWIWITVALIANAVVLAIFLRSNANQSEPPPVAFNETENAATEQFVQQTTTEVNDEPIEMENSEENIAHNNETESTPVSDDRPLSMEAEANTESQIDRPLIYESKQDENTQSPSMTLPSEDKAVVASASEPKKGSVSFSEKELSLDEIEEPIVNAPKLLIDQGNEPPPTQVSSNHVAKLKDLPLISRDNLSQYEVNVHVFDDRPEQRFVLINMDKYKEGDRVANNGPIVDEITREGVIVDYGSGKVLLPPK